MIKELEKYLDEDEKELLSLIHFHQQYIERLKTLQGGLHPDNIELMKMLENDND